MQCGGGTVGEQMVKSSQNGKLVRLPLVPREGLGGSQRFEKEEIDDGSNRV